MESAIAILAGALLYFAPSLVAHSRHLPPVRAFHVQLVNLWTGWTIIGWFYALELAFRRD